MFRDAFSPSERRPGTVKDFQVRLIALLALAILLAAFV